MATYRSNHTVHLVDETHIVRSQLQRDMFDGAETPTYIRLASLSGTIDRWTEEVTYHTAPILIAVSGIIGAVNEKDTLLGWDGKASTGDTMVTYHYSAISGVYHNRQLLSVQLATPVVSGVFHVEGRYIETLAGQPMFIKVALVPDRNG